MSAFRLSMPAFFLLCVFSCLPVFALPVQSETGYPVTELLPAPDGESLVSFDWDASGGLYLMTGDPFWGLLLKVYRDSGAGRTVLFNSDQVFPGSRATVIGPYLYFNDGGDYFRWDADYYCAPLAGGEPFLAYTVSGGSPSLWGVDTRDGTQFFAAGAEGYGPSAIYHMSLSGSGVLDSLVRIGVVGESSGPIAFDAAGGLYYAHGYAASIPATIYRWTAEEVAAAIANPMLAPLTPDGHEFATLPAHFTGAAGMVVDAAGNVLVTANVWGEPAGLLLYRVGEDGENTGMTTLASHASRLETLRVHDGKVCVNSAEGIYSLPMPLTVKRNGPAAPQAVVGEPVTLAVRALGGAGTVNYRWHKVTADKADTVVGGNSPLLTITPKHGDNGAVYYCALSDSGLSGVESPRFTLTVRPAVPVSAPWALLAMALLLMLAARFRLRRAIG